MLVKYTFIKYFRRDITKRNKFIILNTTTSRPMGTPVQHRACWQSQREMEEFEFRSQRVGRFELFEFSPVQAWCYCFSLKNGAVIIGLGGLSMSLLGFLAGTLAICDSLTVTKLLEYCHLYLPDKFMLPVSSAVAGASLLCAACYCVLVTGVYLEDQRMIQTWIVFQIFVIVFHISLAIPTYFVFRSYILVILLVTSIMTALNFHCYGVVRAFRCSFVKTCKEENKEENLAIRVGHYSMRTMLKMAEK